MFILVSKESVHDTIKNRFTIHLSGCSRLENRFHVRISPRLVSFFYYDYDYLAGYNGSIVKDITYEREIGSISLTLPQNTNNDLLTFPQTITGLKLDLSNPLGSTDGEVTNKDDDEKKEIRKEINTYNKIWQERFWGFPFVDLVDNPDDETSETCFSRFLRFCLLCFIFEFENRESAFGESPIYDEVRDNLRKSEVYNLLSAKIHYTLFFFDKAYLSKNKERYSYYTREYANRLMDKRLNIFIRPDRYILSQSTDHCPETQKWFYNPEHELDSLLEKNRKHLDKEGEMIGAARLDESLVADISSFLYAKHALFKAMTTRVSKSLFNASQWLMLVLNVPLLCFLFSFTGRFWDFLFDDNGVSVIAMSFLAGFAILALGLSFFSGFTCIQSPKDLFERRQLGGDSGFKHKSLVKGGFKHGFDALLPRILFAEVAAWFTVVVAESLLTSMLWVEMKGIALVFFILLLLLGLLLFYKVSQFSPYCSRSENSVKVFFILNHSMFYALVLGCLMQGSFYNNMLKSSSVLSEGVYKGHFDTVEDYLLQLEDLEKSIEDYRVFARDYEFGSAQLRGDNSGRTGIAGNLVLYNGGTVVDSATLVMENRISFGTTLNSLVGSNIPKYHQGVANNIIESAKSIKSNQVFTPSMFSACLDTLLSLDTQISKDIIDNNIRMINGEITVLKDEIRETKRHLMSDDYDTLIKWATRGNESTMTADNANDSGGYVNSLMFKEKEKKCSIKMAKGRLFPQLLLLHTLNVLILTFVTQLIVSSKAVTEPITRDFDSGTA